MVLPIHYEEGNIHSHYKQLDLPSVHRHLSEFCVVGIWCNRIVSAQLSPASYFSLDICVNV